VRDEQRDTKASPTARLREQVKQLNPRRDGARRCELLQMTGGMEADGRKLDDHGGWRMADGGQGAWELRDGREVWCLKSEVSSRLAVDGGGEGSTGRLDTAHGGAGGWWWLIIGT